MKNVFLITAPPRTGKTTLIKKIVQQMGEENFCGFITEEMRENGERVGFKVKEINGKEFILAHINIKSDHKISRYFVDADAFENFAADFFSRIDKNKILVIDEMGPMEMLSSRFRQEILDLFDSQRPILGTISVDIHMESDSIELIELSVENRDAAACNIIERLQLLMGNTVITSGHKYIDIDAYASCIAYRELLKAQNQKAFAVSSAPPNDSIPGLIKKIPLGFDSYTSVENDKFIILDTSNPDSFDKIVNQKNIIEIIDHHTGYEEYWCSQTNVKSQIEPIGSVATVIYEKFAEVKLEKMLTSDLCKLLIAAIADNTLNLKANITTERDKIACKRLLQLGGLNHDWVQDYFENCEQAILSDLENAIKNDTKPLSLSTLPTAVGQLAVYNHEKVLAQRDLFRKAFGQYNDWVVNIISLKDGKSYLLAEHEISKTKLEKLFNKKFDKDILRFDKFLLRKEIIALAQKS